MKVRRLFLLMLMVGVSSSVVFAQSRITRISAKAFYNVKGVFSTDLVEKSTSDGLDIVDGQPQPSEQTLIIVEIFKTPEYGGPDRLLNFEASIGDKVILQKQVKLAFGGFKYQTLFLLNQDAVNITVKADLIEGGKLVSTMKKNLLIWAGD